MGESLNEDVVHDVFNRCDAVVVPSIWAGNSWLVAHEALRGRVPVVTAGRLQRHGGVRPSRGERLPTILICLDGLTCLPAISGASAPDD